MRRGIKVVHSCCSTQHSKGNPRLSFHIPFSLFAFPSFNHQWMHISITLGEGRFSHLELLRVSLMLPLIPPIHPTFCIPIFLLYPWIVHTLHLCILTPPPPQPSYSTPEQIPPELLFRPLWALFQLFFHP